MRDAVRRLTRGSPLFRRGRRSLRIPPPPPKKSHSASGIFHSTSGAIQNPRLTRFAAMRDAVRRLTRGSPLFRRDRRSLRIPPPPPSGNNTNPRNGFVLFFAVGYLGVALNLKLNVRTKETLSTRKFPLAEREFSCVMRRKSAFRKHYLGVCRWERRIH